jgi:hypothetical protein
MIDAQAATVRFGYKDYADGARCTEMTLGCGEFIRRLLLHILPERFVKIRHYGILSNRNRRTRIAQARSVLPPMPELNSDAAVEPTCEPAGLPERCPHCQHASWVLVQVLKPEAACARRHPPRYDSS